MGDYSAGRPLPITGKYGFDGEDCMCTLVVNQRGTQMSTQELMNVIILLCLWNYDINNRIQNSKYYSIRT